MADDLALTLRVEATYRERAGDPALARLLREAATRLSPPEGDKVDPIKKAAAKMLKAGDALSFAAQTSGGVAGRDEGLVEAIEGWTKARDAYKTICRIVKYEPGDLPEGDKVEAVARAIHRARIAKSEPAENVESIVDENWMISRPLAEIAIAALAALPTPTAGEVRARALLHAADKLLGSLYRIGDGDPAARYAAFDGAAFNLQEEIKAFLADAEAPGFIPLPEAPR